MEKSDKKALLPPGLTDLLPPEADHEEAVTRRLLDCFAGYGYQRTKPPLMEFEEGLFDGVGASLTGQTFRVMDPQSHRMMGVRADITPQIARIASTRLAGAPRPLRLSYSGEVLRVRGVQLRPERQFRQIGVELIGAASAAMADAEVILLAADAAATVGIGSVSVDVSVPTLARTLCGSLGASDAASARLMAAIDRKDAAALGEIGAEAGVATAAGLLRALLDAAGPAQPGLAALAALDLPDAARPLVDRLAEVVSLVAAARPDLGLTIDPVESRGFEYHVGVSFTLFALGARGELGSGGRYLTPGGEPATGFTLNTDALRHAAPPAPARPRVFVPFEAPAGTAADLRADGRVAVQGLVAVARAASEARRLECTHVWTPGGIQPADGD